MPPRRNGRSTKAGLRRIDAAYDALQSLGFSKTVVRRNINKLLKEYGQNGWVFIEEASYRLVIETILEEQEKEGTVGEAAMAEGQEEVASSHHLQVEATDDQAYSMSFQRKKLAIFNDEDELAENERKLSWMILRLPKVKRQKAIVPFSSKDDFDTSLDEEEKL